MKRVLLILLCFLFVAGAAFGEAPATPTDLVENEYVKIDDDDWGEVTIKFERQVYIDVDPKRGVVEGDLVTFTAILVNFQTDDVFTFQWQYTSDTSNWVSIDGATEQTYSFIVDKENYQYWWRVMVTLLEEYE